MEVTFFGHRDAPPSIKPALEKTIRYLINSQNATVFYVGNNGNFDLFVADILHKLTSEFSQIKYYIVLAYMPQKSNMIQQVYLPHTLYPESVANGIPKFAISRPRVVHFLIFCPILPCILQAFGCLIAAVFFVFLK